MLIKKYLVIRLLKKLRLLQHINIRCRKKIKDRIFYIPVYKGIGLSNLFLHRDWMDNLMELFLNSQKMCFVDVGTNIGISLLRAKSHKFDINYLGFEPNSNCVTYINEFIKINNFSNCRVYNCALSKEIFTTSLKKTTSDDTRASIIPEQRPGFFNDQEFVIALPYDILFQDNAIDFLKIDVEGAELDVLYGMIESIKQYRPWITCEILDSFTSETMDFTQKKANEIVRLIKSLNYKILQIITDGCEIKRLKDIEFVSIQQWTHESSKMNDYFFYPEEKQGEVRQRLKRYISQ